MKNIAVVGMGEMGSIFSQKIKDANVFTYLSKIDRLKQEKG